MSLEQHGMGMNPHVGAAIYEGDDGPLIALLSPEEEAIQFLLDGLGVPTLRELRLLVETGRETARLMEPITEDLRRAGVPDELLPNLGGLLRDDDPDTILRWIEAGFPPWGCHACRGAERGPDGVPCPSCGGDSASMKPPERAEKIRQRFADLNLALWFTPQCIRDHYDGDEGPEADWVAAATDEELAAVGSDALSHDPLYREFHEALQDCVRERAGIEA